MGMVYNGNSIAGLLWNGLAVSALYNGEIVWPTAQPALTYSIEFGGGGVLSAGLSAEYGGNVIYSSPVSTGKRTATGIPYGAVIYHVGSSPKYYTFVASSYTGLSGFDTTYDGQRDGMGTTSTGYLTADATAMLSDEHTKDFRVQGNWPKPGTPGRYASVYARPTSFSSWHGSSMSSDCKLAIRDSWTANNVSHQGTAWGAGGNVTAAGWQPRNVSGNMWSGWCDTTGTVYTVYGYIETAGGFATIGRHNSAGYIARSWGTTTNQNFYCAGRSAGGNCPITAINGYWWATGIAP